MKDFFKNYNNCYWAGFISADGSLGGQWASYTVAFQLSSKDHGFLEKLKFETKSKCEVKKFSRVKNGTTYYFSRFNLHSKSLCDDLINDYNMSSNKTFDYDPPKEKFTNQQRREFIKGVIDGDGHIRNRKEGLNKSIESGSFNIKILGTKGNLKMIVDHCKDLKLKIKYSKIKQYGGTNCLDLWGKDARTLFLDLYENVPQYMERKWPKEFYDHCKAILKKSQKKL